MRTKKINILLIEDDEDDASFIRDVIGDGFRTAEVVIDSVETYEGAILLLQSKKYDVCLLDYWLGEKNGVSLLRTLTEKHIELPVILLTGRGNPGVAVEAMKSGAYDYLAKEHLSADILSQSITYAIKLHDEEEQRKSAEDSLRRQDHLLQGLADASNRLLTIHDHEKALNETLVILGESIDVDSVCIFEHLPYPGNAVSARFSWTRSGRDKALRWDNVKYESLGRPEWLDILSSGNPIIEFANDLPITAKESCKAQGIQSIAIVPIVIDEIYWGFMGLGDCSKRYWSKNEISILKAAAANIGGKIKNELEEKAFRSIVEGTSSRVGVEFFESLVHHLASALSVRCIIVTEYLESVNQCRIRAGWDGTKKIQTVQYTPKLTPCEKVLSGRSAFDVEIVHALYPKDIFPSDIKIRSYAGVPFHDSTSKTIGHLAVIDEKPMIFEQRTLSVLKIFAARLGAELERERTEDTIKQMAYYDALTGLPNRVLLHDRLQLAMIQAVRGKKMLAVLYVDFDRFKIINDTLGHAIGDLLLQEVSQRLKACLREGDTVARLGGDEFIILQPDIKIREDSGMLAQKLLEKTRQPMVLEGHKLNITLSIGIAIFPADGEEINLLLKNADTALYLAKEHGRDNYQYYSQIISAKEKKLT